jgi:outer membrane protein OmpA-like peptidoglycan-associated protein
MSGCKRAWRPFLAVLVLLSFAACASRETPQYPPRSFFVFFPAGSAELPAEAGTVLDQIADEAKRINATAVGIVGYSSVSGVPAANLRLADERATAVETALALRQVPRAIIVRTYEGSVQELAGPQLAEQRVEVVVSRAER